jgi:hypothetical protein
MIGALDVFSVEVTAVEWHAAMRTGVAQGEGTTRTVAPDDERNL